MARERDFVNKLSDFTDALEDLVEILKEKESSGENNVMGELLNILNADTIKAITEDLSEIKTTVKQTNKNTEKTLELLKASKKKDETGMFGQIDDKKNKGKIIDGVKTVILIAAGVLAIGMAFKIIGQVDFLSVVALGMGIMFIAAAFTMVAFIKDKKGNPLTLKQAFTTSLILIIISASVLGAGLLLKNMPALGLMQMLTAAGVGLSMGLATYFLLEGIGRLSLKEIGMAIFVPLLIPLIAGGIVAAGFILQNMPEVTLKQIISALGVSIALAPIAIAFGFLIRGLDKADMKDLIFAGLAIPIMAAGIVAASIILQYVQPIPLKDVIIAGIGIGIATLLMVPTMFILSKSGLTKNIAELALAGLAIVIISTAIMISSWILSVGKYEGYPDWKWALGVGLALLTFLPTVLITGALIMVLGPIGFGALALGIIGTALVAQSIVEVSKILPKGTYDKYPSFDWVAGVGLSLITFTTAMITLGILMITGVGYLALLAGKEAVNTVIEAIISAGTEFTKRGSGKFESGTYPSYGWSLGVGLALVTFATIMTTLGALNLVAAIFGGEFDIVDFIKTSTNALIQAGNDFTSRGKGQFEAGTFPSKDWAEGVGISLVAFAQVMARLQFLNVVSEIFGTEKFDIIDFVKNSTNALIEAGIQLTLRGKGQFAEGTYPSENWSKGVGQALIAFAEVMGKLQKMDLVNSIKSFLIGGENEKVDLVDFVKKSTDALIQAGASFTKNGAGLFAEGTYPSENWAKGVGGSLVQFAIIMQVLEKLDIDLKEDPEYLNNIITLLAGSLITAGQVFTNASKQNLFDETSIPSEAWGNSISAVFSSFNNVLNTVGDTSAFKTKTYDLSMSLYTMAYAFSKMPKSNEENLNILVMSIEKVVKVLPKQEDVEPLKMFVEILTKLANVPFDNLKNISNITKLISKLSETINDLNINKVNSLFSLSSSLQMLGLVDNAKLNQTLTLLQSKQAELKSIFDSGGGMMSNFTNKIGGLFGQEEKPNVPGGGEKSVTVGSPFEEKMLKLVENIDGNIVKIANPEKTELETLLKGANVEDIMELFQKR
jgi:hypothetical protein